MQQIKHVCQDVYRRLALVALVVALALLTNLAQAAAPTNDQFEAATVITTLPYTQTPAIDPREATTDITDPLCMEGGYNVWYQFTADVSQRLRADTLGSNYDTALCIYTGTAGALTLYASNDDSLYQLTLQSEVDFDVVMGTTYYFMVESRTLAAGDTLRFALGPATPRPTPTPTPTPTPPPVTLTVSVSSAGQVIRSNGTAKISGTMSCSQPVTATLTVSLSQQSRRRVVSGTALAEVACVGVTPWSVVVYPQGGSFAQGNAEAWAKVEALGAAAETTQTVNLKSK